MKVPILRKFLALACVAALLLAALSPIPFGLLFAFLIPVWFFFADVASFPVTSADEASADPVFGFVAVFSPRPPPIH